MAKKIKMSQEEIEKYNAEIKKLPSKKSKLTIAFIVLTIIFTISLIGSIIYFNNDISSLKKENDELASENAQLVLEKLSIKSDLDSILGSKTKSYIERKLEFFDESIVFRIEGFGNYYYTYDCMMKKVGNNKFTYWGYNKEAAISDGLRAGGC